MVEVDVILEDPRWADVDLTHLAQAAAMETLAHLGAKVRHNLAVLGCDDARIAELNGDFRQKPAPTNVLSWPAEERASPGRKPPLPDTEELGDIAIAYETCASEAEAQGKTIDAHVRHLLVHGILHLLGYDHDLEQDAALMERTEVEILAKMGIEDPYRSMG